MAFLPFLFSGLDLLKIHGFSFGQARFFVPSQDEYDDPFASDQMDII